MNEALHEPAEETLVVERRRAVGFLMRTARIVQKHEIEIGAIAELETRELAVADDGKPRFTQRRSAPRRAVLRDELVARGAQRKIEHELGSIRQPVADLHERQRAEAVRDGNAEQRGALEHADRIEHGFDIAFGRSLRRAVEQRRQLVARRRRVEDAVVEQLIEQQRLLGDLSREQRAVDDELQ